MFYQTGKLTPLSALWGNPQQYTFAIMNDNLTLPPGSPAGTLWATSFEVIPEPAAAGLVLALSALGFAGVRRVNKKRWGSDVSIIRI